MGYLLTLTGNGKVQIYEEIQICFSWPARSMPYATLVCVLFPDILAFIKKRKKKKTWFNLSMTLNDSREEDTHPRLR